MKRIKFAIILSLSLIFSLIDIYAQISITLSVGSEPQQTFQAFGWSISATDNPYMKGKVTSNIRDSYGKAVFEDLNTEVVRLWYGHNVEEFKNAYIKSGFLEEARKHGVKYFLLAPGGYFPESVVCSKYLCDIQEYANIVAGDIKVFQDLYNVRIDATGIINEPGAGERDNVRAADYTTVVKTFRNTLDQLGLQHVKIIALEHWSPTDENSLPFAQAIAADPEASKALDGYSTHSYGFAIDRPHAEIVMKNGWEYWMGEAGGAPSGSDISARFLNDLNNAATHWVFFLGAASGISEHTLAAPINGSIVKSFHYYPLQQISNRFIPNTQMRHVISSLNGDMIYQRSNYPGINAAAGVRPDGKWVIGISNITDAIHEKSAASYNITLNIPELKEIPSLTFEVCRTLDNSNTIQQYDNTIFFQNGQGFITVRSGEVITLTALTPTEPSQYNYSNRLSGITWPDIPDSLKNTLGWKGDTIPDFTPENTNYTITLPFGTKNIPALFPITQDINAIVNVKCASSFNGNEDERTTVFTVTSGDNLTIQYHIQFATNENSDIIQHFVSEPIISQVSMNVYQATSILEIANIGTQPIDLSHYMLVTAAGKNPEEAIKQFTDTSINGTGSSFANRYNKYIPGYSFANDSDTWKIKPAFLFKDETIDPIVKAGDVFVLQSHPVLNSGGWFTEYISLWDEADVVLTTGDNPWGAEISGDNNWFKQFNLVVTAGFLFKIKNDSILSGQKGIYDPDDFELIDNFGSWDNTLWSYAGITPDIWSNKYRFYNITRKENILKGNTGHKTSMGTNENDGEWYVRKMGMEPIEVNSNVTKALWEAEGTGSHNVLPVTFFKSTIRSTSYSVSNGFSGLQSVMGVDINVSLDEFLDNIIKEDTGQKIEVHSITDGTVKSSGDMMINKDTLIVTSGDNQNITKYLISVAEGGLSSDAVLSSMLYNININEAEGTGTISGMNYGVSICGVIDNIIKPESAIMYVTDQNGAFIPLNMLNYRSDRVNTSVHDSIYFKVIAQDGETIITYDLEPASTSSDAFVTSDVYEVNQEDLFIRFIPSETTVSTLLRNVRAVKGASIMVIDTIGFQRNTDKITLNYKLKVTSEDGSVTTSYALIPLKSGIFSNVYIVSSGTEELHSIIGVDTNTGRPDFLNNIIKSDPDCSLEVHKAIDGSVVTREDIITDHDTLIVISADEITITKYLIKTLAGGLASDAILTSILYNIVINETYGRGVISAMDFGVSIVEVLSNIKVPPTAVLYVLDQDNKNVPLYKMNNNSVNTATSVNDSIKFLVIAQDRKTSILYQMESNASASDAFVISDLYEVNQDQLAIRLIPYETFISEFLKNIIPVTGATLKVLNNTNTPLTAGYINPDYKLEVTSRDNSNTVLYDLIILGGEAYVTSDVLTINQNDKIIGGIPPDLELSEFLELINIAPDATFKIIDKYIHVKTSGQLESGDILMVISANGKIMVEYDLDFSTSIQSSDTNNNLRIYPNPTSGHIFINGLNDDHRIEITDILGNTLIEYTGKSEISLEPLSSGVYIILIRDKNNSLQYCSKIFKN